MAARRPTLPITVAVGHLVTATVRPTGTLLVLACEALDAGVRSPRATLLHASTVAGLWRRIGDLARLRRQVAVADGEADCTVAGAPAS